MRNKKIYLRWSLVALLIVLIGAGIGSTAAKYVYQKQMKGKVTFTAELAKKIELLEHKAVSTLGDENPASNYKLTGDVVLENTYKVLPGVDIPKDPFVKITGKTSIPAYLYVEVVDTTPKDSGGASIISFTVDDVWSQLSVTGKHEGGTVYCYNPAGGQKLTGNGTGELQIYILEGGKDAVLTVSDSYLAYADANDKLTFYAYLYEVFEKNEGGTSRDATPEEVFNENNVIP